MDTIDVSLKHCYGIKEMSHRFDFRETRVYAIYAPNGAMKSSLALTFKDAANARPSSDRVFPGRPTSRELKDESGKSVPANQILVVGPYDEKLGPTEETATLLVDSALRAEYRNLHAAIDSAKEAFLRAINKKAGSKRNFEQEISSAFTPSTKKFRDAVTRIRREVEKQPDAPLAELPYDTFFNDQVAKALEDPSVRTAIDDYIQRYNQLLDASTFFRKGMFDYYNAAQIADHLSKNGFFEAKHTIILRGQTGTLEINNQQDLERVVAEEKAALLKDENLRARFDEVDKHLQKNAATRALCKYLQNHEALLPKMANLPELRENAIKSLIKANEGLYTQMMEQYEEAENRLAEIEKEARAQRTQWEVAVETFNERFIVPFRLDVRNRTEVMIGAEPIMDLAFTYTDGKDSAPVERTKLLEILSTGERRAHYILNVLFEVERRKKEGTATLLIADDIADSFDYQNKYAIIQYLKDISEDERFKLIIMTHNFDFFRTLESRFVDYKACLTATKGPNGVSLSQATGIRNVFAKDWKGQFFDDPMKKIASIPFLRNLIEMTTGGTDPNYATLTAALHWRAETAAPTVADLDRIFNQLCGTNRASQDQATAVHELVRTQAAACLSGPTGSPLENKIVLAIAIRLAAERFMAEKINEPGHLAQITSHQTQALIKRFKERFPGKADAHRTLDKVALMTPENIHVNAFMYEPIIDMADDHLKRLYRDVLSLD